jgi:hypothetical protein
MIHSSPGTSRNNSLSFFIISEINSRKNSQIRVVGRILNGLGKLADNLLSV